MDVFDLDLGDKFIWQERTYVLIGFDADQDNAIVREVGHRETIKFNPCAKIRKVD